jgi:hypothetical protein
MPWRAPGDRLVTAVAPNLADSEMIGRHRVQPIPAGGGVRHVFDTDAAVTIIVFGR